MNGRHSSPRTPESFNWFGAGLRAGTALAMAWLGLWLLCLASVEVRGADALSNKECLECHADKDLTRTNETGKVFNLYTDEARLAASVHKTNNCAACHADLKRTHPDDNVPAKPVACSSCHARQSESYGASVHGIALRAGKKEAAGCGDCHGTHDIAPAGAVSSRLHFSKLAATCGECHPDVARDVQESVHGRAVAKGNRAAATCSDCHAEHRIEDLRAGSPVKMAEQICGKCHASERLNTRFKMPADRLKTFFESYHGLAAQLGSTRAANCASCHGVHRILRSSDPRSTIHKDHLVETCGKCHAGATQNFALGKVHLDGDLGQDTGAVVNRWVRRAYLALIFLVIGGMVLHNFLDWLRKALLLLRSAARREARMSVHQRWQHFILLASFIVLAASGFALKYPDARLTWIMGTEDYVRRWIHRIAGLILLGVGGYHLVYLAVTAEGRRLVKDLWPGLADLKELAAKVRYLAGRGPSPSHGRFGYAEKAEYWAVLWGTLIMGVTGLMIWLKIDVTRWLPRWAVEVATTVHYYEAILACLAIVVWHLYHVMFDPRIYPLNWAWWDGKAPPADENHPAPGASAEGKSHSAPPAPCRSDDKKG